jgi:predicted extracellular nuclease
MLSPVICKNKNCSSEALFVFTNQYPDVIPGDLVRVNGKVQEFTPGDEEDLNLSTTEIDSDSYQIIMMNVELPPAITIGAGGRIPPDIVIDDDGMRSFDIDSDGIDFYESLEGMRVQVLDSVVVESANKYNELIVIPSELVFNNVVSKSGALIQFETDMNPERILLQLSDGFKINVWQGQHSDTPIIGILGYEYGNYRILVTNNPSFSGSTGKPGNTESESGLNQIRLVTYNIHNFNRFDSDKLEDIASQVVDDLGLPDILVLQEVQDDSGISDDGTTSASQNLNALVDAIYAESRITYAFFDPNPQNNSSGGASGANIRTVILYRTDRGLSYLGDHSNTISDHEAFQNTREPVVCRFLWNEIEFFVVGVHLTSNNLNTPLFGASQPIEKPEEAKRINQAESIANMTENLLAQNPQAGIIIAGDFNDAPWSDALTHFAEIGMTNSTEFIVANERYSILYEGNANLFDQIIISQNLIEEISGIEVLHLNTPNPENLQVSDHDPVVLDIQF